MLIPDIDVFPNSDGFTNLETADLEAVDFVVAVEMELLEPGRYLYVLFIDPSGTLTSASVMVSVRPGTLVQNVDIVDGLPVPSWTTNGNTDVLATPDDPSVWSRNSGGILDLTPTGSNVVGLDIGNGPLLFSTSLGTRLEFEVTTTSSNRFRRCRYGRDSARCASRMSDLLRAGPSNKPG